MSRMRRRVVKGSLSLRHDGVVINLQERKLKAGLDVCEIRNMGTIKELRLWSENELCADTTGLITEHQI
jgi:hypothetical protein